MKKIAALLKAFEKTKKIAFIDGDQPIPTLLSAYTKYVANTGTESHFIKAKKSSENEPKALRNNSDLNKIYLEDLSTGKEVVDKFIGAYIQKAVSEGYKEITVISSDYDFIDIFKMAVQLDPNAGQVLFKLIVPHPQGKVCELPEKMLNIEVVKHSYA
jgi:hypothetical protein